ncbi:MAG: hypothetical protein LBI94_06150 [Treponema sp.]|nr:hypothetical protein [Treponema sp.]
MLLILTACASVPRSQDPLPEQKIPLDGGAAAYLFINVPAARPILNQVNLGGYNSAQLGEILDKTRFAAAALYSRSIRAVAWGDYPSFRAGMALGMSKEWKRQRSAAGKSYWYSAGRRLSLALERGRAFAALETAGFGPAPAETAALSPATGEAVIAAGPYAQGPGIDIPEGFNAFREDAPLALWMENPAEPLDRFLGMLRLPIRIPAEQLMAALSALPGTGLADPQNTQEAAVPALPAAENQETLYEIRLQIRTPSEASARTFMTLYSTARLFILRSGSQGNQETIKLLNIFFTRPAEQQGAYITLHSPPLNEHDIALLFNQFSVYSQGNLVIQ